MSADLPHLATSEEIVQMHAKMEELKLLMAERRHGGAGKQGRYLKHDTARLSFIDGCGLCDLAGGKLLSAADQRALFDLPGDLEIAGTPEQKEMDEWRNRHHADPRSKAHKDAGLSIQRQTTLLAWVHSNAAAFARPSAPRGAPSAYRLDFGPYVGYTLMDLVSPALKGFFQRTVAAMVDTPYRKWSRLWAEAAAAAIPSPERAPSWI